jgi:hypothetical protein
MTFYRRWILACATGEVVGIGVATGAALAVNAAIGEPQSITARLLTLATFAGVGAVEGTALAGLQWRVLRARLPDLRPGPWIGATVALAVAGWIAGMTPSLLMSPETGAAPVEPPLPMILLMAGGAGAAAGFLFGFAQWIVLQHHAEHAARWIWIHVPAWALAMSAIFLGASIPDASSSPSFIAVMGLLGGALGGVLLGVITGLVARTLNPMAPVRDLGEDSAPHVEIV